jgi:putative endonuclease
VRSSPGPCLPPAKSFLGPVFATGLLFFVAHFLYILRSLKDGSSCIGTTADPHSRIERHNRGRSAYTKSRRAWELIYWERHRDRAGALTRERRIKARKSKDCIARLVGTSRQP